jgi:YARHG domain
MRNFLLLLLVSAFALGCNNNKTASQTDNNAVEEMADKKTAEMKNSISPDPSPGPLEKLLGSFVGPFGTNKITMLITKVSGDSVAGRTIVGGNDRPFRGTFRQEGDAYIFNAKEPGDHKDDGEFNFSINETSTETLRGSWKPNAKGKPAKEYELQKKAFAYRTDVGDYPQASQRLLKPKDVENEMKEDLEFMRNEIFARHGYCFSKKNLRQQFEMKDWYVPNTVNIKGFLTDIEKKNIELIKRYEKYAEEYGDEYGR